MDIDRLLDLEPYYNCYKDEDLFDLDFIPPNFEYRDDEMEALAVNMRPILYGKKPPNTLILGNSGTGKTTAIILLLDSFEKKHENMCCCHVNCQFNDSVRAVYIKIYKKLFEDAIIGNSKGTKDIFNEIMTHLSKEKITLILCLDDIDNIFYQKEFNKFIYKLSRPHEEGYKNVNIGLFIIVSNNDFCFRLDKKTRSSFKYKEVRFKDYSMEQVFQILKERCRLGFCEKVINDDKISQIANYCSVFGNLKDGLEILTSLGHMINTEGDCKIRDEHIDIVLNEWNLYNQ